MDEKKPIEIKVENFFTKVLAIIGKTTDAQIAELLDKSKLTISTAESLTGGMLSSRLVAIPGSSNYFIGGIVCYHNRVKVTEVNVPPATISKHGPVSKETALAMAEGVRKRLKTDIGLSVTGVAGPEPALNAPPGLTYIALASERTSHSKELHLQGTRTEIREKATQAALGLLWLYLGGDEVIDTQL